MWIADNQAFYSAQYFHLSFVNLSYGLETRPPILLTYEIAVSLSDLILTCLHPFHKLLDA